MRYLLIALLVFAACQSGGSGTGETTADPPVARDLTPCSSRPSIAIGAAASTDWPVYHRTADRHGVGSSSPAAAKLAPLWGMRLDGWVFAQPLVFQDLVVTATDNDTLYAFEAQTGCLVWQNHLGEPLNGQAAGLCGAQSSHEPASSPHQRSIPRLERST